MEQKDRGNRVLTAGARLWTDRSGIMAVMTALGAAVLMGLAGLAIDVAYWEMNGRKIQGAADDAATAASGFYAATSNATEAATLAKAVAASHGFVDGSNSTTVYVNTGYDTASTTDASKCTSTNSGSYTCVAIWQTQPQFFTKAFYGLLHTTVNAPTVKESAVAKPPGSPSNGNMCVMALDETGKLAIQSVDLPSNTNVDLECDLYNDSGNVDSTQLSGGATLTVNNMYLAGNYETDNNSTLTVNGYKATYIQPSADPYAGLTVSSFSGCSQGQLSPVKAWSPGSSTTINASGSTPYVICGGLTVNNGVTLTLGAGTYVIDSGKLVVNGGGTLTGTGVTIILSSSTGSSNIGTISFNGSSTVTLTAPTTGATAGTPGVAIWVDKNAPTTGSDTFNGGANENINGAIYLPTHQLTYSGGSKTGVGNGITKCSQVIALTATFSGNSYFTHAYCASMNLPVKDPAAPPTLAR